MSDDIYVIWYNSVWELDEWNSSDMASKYDDVIYCVVDFSHKAYNEERFEEEMIDWYNGGPCPEYAAKQ